MVVAERCLWPEGKDVIGAGNLVLLGRLRRHDSMNIIKNNKKRSLVENEFSG